MFTKIGIGLAVLGVVSLGVGFRFVHSRDRMRGVTDEKVDRPLPGDDALPKSEVIATRAETMEATPEQVWSALLQAGSRRDSQDDLNRFDQDTLPGGEETLPASPQLAIGHMIGQGGFSVQAIEPPRLLLLTSHSPKTKRAGNSGIWPTFGDCSWAFVLEPIGEGRTRLMSRVRYAFMPGVPRLLRPLIKGVHILLQLRMLRETRHRVEEGRSTGQRKGVLPFGNKGGHYVEKLARKRSFWGRLLLTPALLLCIWGVGRRKGVLPFRNKLRQRMSSPILEGSSVWEYFLLTYAMMLSTWGIMALFHLKGVSALPNAPKPSAGELLLFLLGGCTPSLAGILMTWRTGGRSGLRALWRRAIQFNLGWQWYLVTLLPLVAMLSLVGVYLLRGGALNESAPLFQPLGLLSFALGLFVTGPLTEELGWRGFALDQLLARWDPLCASLVLGLLWSFWHLPLYFIPNSIQQQSGVVEFPVFLVSILSKTVLMTWVYLATGRSFWSALWFHFTSNFAETSLRSLTGGARAYRLLHNGLTAFMAALVALNWSRRTPAALAGIA